MELGERLRHRARELGLADAEVARRLGLSQSRYAHYVSGVREPDFATFVRICRALAFTPDVALGFSKKDEGMPAERVLRERIMAVVTVMDEATLRTAAALLDALVASVAGVPPSDTVDRRE